jgi:hypothetical protein
MKQPGWRSSDSAELAVPAANNLLTAARGVRRPFTLLEQRLAVAMRAMLQAGGREPARENHPGPALLAVSGPAFVGCRQVAAANRGFRAEAA